MTEVEEEMRQIKKVNVPPPHLRRATIRSQVGGVHGGGRARSPDLRLTQALKLGGQPIGPQARQSRVYLLKEHVTLRLSCLACHMGSSLKPINTPQGPHQKVNTRSVRASNSSLPLGQGQLPNNLPPQLPPQLPPLIPNMFPLIDHAEGGDENQPHNSAHNSTSIANHDIVAAQLATMQQQFGVFQLVLAQLLPRNNPGDPLINLLNPAQQPLPPQQNPQPVQHAPTLSESQDQSHIAPAQQPLPDEVTRRLDSLEKLLNTYDGTKDLDDHLHAFYSYMQVQNASNALMCKIFSSTLRAMPELVLEVSSFDQAVRIAAVISGLNHDRLKDSLIKHPATTFSERDENPSKKRMRMTQNRGLMPTSTLRFERPNSAPPQQSASKPPVTWTPFNLPRSQIFMQIKNKMDLRRLDLMRTAAASRDHTRYCDFHQDHGHTIEQCNSLREQRPQPQGVRNPPNRQGVGYQQAPPPLPPPARIIHMITGGLEAGGLSSKQRKLYVREVKHQNRAKKRKFDDADWKNQPITFTSANLDAVVTPHNDPLVTSVMINNCECSRYDGPIYGFNNQPVPVEGVLTMNVAFGSGRNHVTPSVRFLVVKMASSFNVVIGQPTLTEIRTVVSQAAPVEDVEEVPINDRDLSRKTQIGTRLNPEERAELIAFLRANNDVFAWTSTDMPGIPNSVSQHKLSTNPLKKPVAQKRCLFRGERLQAIKEEANGKWRMCIDYTNLNQACPKDCYPMPSIDKLVEAASGNERLSLLDAYSGYHQVPMALEDEEKTSFYAGDEIYCYVMMPFGLKNTECTPCHSTPNPKPNDWTLYVEGASNNKGSGAGALLIGPDGYRSKHALKFNFDATNNMAEYEALLLGLQLALELKINAIQVYNDSQLVVNQINSIYEVVDPVMVKYVALVADLKCKFQKFCLSKIPRTENEQADSLSKFASNSSLSSRSVFVEVLDEPSFMKPRMMEISTDPDTPSWTDSIISFLRDETVPEDKQEAMRLRKKASRYTLVDGVLYKRSFSLPLLRCLNPYEAEYALREIHEGVCGSHIGARTLAHKVLRQGYYWPNMYKDATHFVQRCPKCQFFAHHTHQPAKELMNLIAPWPFAQWGLDLLGPFMKGVGGVTHLIVGVDYFTKWVEARPLSNPTSKKVKDFVFSSIICRYGIPNQIVADNGTQFNCSSFRDFCSNYGIKLQFTSVYHPKSNGETPYHLAFGTETVIPIEIGVPSFWVTHFDEGQNGQLLQENLDLLAEPQIGKVLIRWPKCPILVPLSSKTLKEREFLESGMSTP
ncbi:hypothetical protein SLEP1_g3360 [Rubroshorea leprosula]|uniref:Uncharacterized protein n=1 Tax=Rubroshorea leprosula TaxID=152421 RepID=A0AAV5HTX5_9ROSI|nr:hypothetical protein SLEP1_g3360 [Rubroshorea leprosula]